MSLIFRHRRPTPPLDALIESIWYCERGPEPHVLERVLPTGAAQLIVNLKEDQTRLYHPETGERRATISSGAVFCGVQSSYCVIDAAAQEAVLGVAFRPGGTVPFFRQPAQEMRDATIPLDVLWGPCTRELREQLLEPSDADAKMDALERALAGRCVAPSLHPAVAFALETLARRPYDVTIADVTVQIGLSPKRFIERFKATVGVGPKRYCRILRFQRALARAEQGQRVDWTRVAVDCGYFDQAHFIHDFRSFSGITPTAYQAKRTEFETM